MKPPDPFFDKLQQLIRAVTSLPPAATELEALQRIRRMEQYKRALAVVQISLVMEKYVSLTSTSRNRLGKLIMSILRPQSDKHYALTPLTAHLQAYLVQGYSRWLSWPYGQSK